MSGFGRTNLEKAHEQQVTECRLAEDVHHGVESSYQSSRIRRMERTIADIYHQHES